MAAVALPYGSPGARLLHPLHSYDGVLYQGRITLDALAVDTPGTPLCGAGTIELAGTIDTSATTDNVTATLSGRSHDFVVSTTRYVLALTGAASGADAGDHTTTSNSFTDLHLPTVSFAVRTIDPMTCVVGSAVCSGTATLTLSGGGPHGEPVPIPAGNDLAIDTTAGSVLTKGPCSVWWGFLIAVNGDAGIDPVPVWTDPSAYFVHQ